MFLFFSLQNYFSLLQFRANFPATIAAILFLNKIDEIEFASSSRLVRALSAICRNFSSSGRECGNSYFKWNLSRVGPSSSSLRNNSSITIVRWNTPLKILEIQLGQSIHFLLIKIIRSLFPTRSSICAFITYSIYASTWRCMSFHNVYTYVCIYLRAVRSCWSGITRYSSLFGGNSIESPLRSRGNLLWRQVCAVAIV